MSDPRFFSRRGPFTASALAAVSGAVIRGDPERRVSDVATLLDAQQDDLAFLDNRKYLPQLAECRAGIIVLAPALAGGARADATLLISPKPYKAYALIAQAFHPIDPGDRSGVSPLASVDATASLGQDIEIGPFAVIGKGAKLGNGVRIGANVTIAANVEIGDHTVIGPGSSLTHCIVGARVRMLPGVRVGQEGFGFAMDPEGHVRIPQLGRVIIEDDVDIGANTAIDRGAGPDTIIGRGAMIDNLVQIGHNCVIGPGSVIVAQAGVAGSSRLGRGVVLAAQAGIVGHISVGDGASIGGQCGVMRDVAPGARMMGTPALEARKFFRQFAWVEKMAMGRTE